MKHGWLSNYSLQERKMNVLSKGKSITSSWDNALLLEPLKKGLILSFLIFIVPFFLSHGNVYGGPEKGHLFSQFYLHSIRPFPHTLSWCNAQLVKHRELFFTFPLGMTLKMIVFFLLFHYPPVIGNILGLWKGSFFRATLPNGLDQAPYLYPFPLVWVNISLVTYLCLYLTLYFNPDDGGRIFLWNVSNCMQD
jgi:hypothetical protein